MTSSSQQPIPPAALVNVAAEGTEDDNNERELVGTADAEADAARSGADVDLTDAQRDSDGVPVGQADVQADIDRASGQSEERAE
jgi:hypothetical protein